jgi:hypothetical protein
VTEQSGAARGQAAHGVQVQPVSVAGPVGQIEVHVATELPQRAHEHRRRAHPVDVVVAVNGDPRALTDVTEDRLDRLADAREQLRRVLLAAVQERASERGLGHAPAHQHLRDGTAHTELTLQPRDILLGAIGYLKAAQLHPGETTARVGRNGKRPGGPGPAAARGDAEPGPPVWLSV